MLPVNWNLDKKKLNIIEYQSLIRNNGIIIFQRLAQFGYNERFKLFSCRFLFSSQIVKWALTLRTKSLWSLHDGAKSHVYQVDLRTDHRVFHSVSHPLKILRGGPDSRNDQGVWLVYSHGTRRAAHAHMSETSQRVVNSRIRVLWTWKFGPKMIFRL